MQKARLMFSDKTKDRTNIKFVVTLTAYGNLIHSGMNGRIIPCMQYGFDSTNCKVLKENVQYHLLADDPNR